MRFSDLHLIPPIASAVAAEGYEAPTPIQEKAIPFALEGRDLLACAQTGTGKTAAFALPILQRLAATKSRGIRALVLTPTRELASQIADSFRAYGKNLRIRGAIVFGGVSQYHQERALRDRPDVIVATPGRLLDLMKQGFVSFQDLEVFVLDEADRMLDMGFLPDVRRVIEALPRARQTMLFSATMPSDIQSLARGILRDPAYVEVTPVASVAQKIVQSIYFVEKTQKRALLEHVLADAAMSRVLVFTRTKHGADRVAEQLGRARIGAAAIHGNKSQNARERALAGFKRGDTRVLVATDIAARGIDVDGVTHVVNYDLPNVPESYVHRIGRTARAGAEGIAISFCDAEERPFLRDIERLIKQRIDVVEEHPHRASHGRTPEPVRAKQGAKSARRRGGVHRSRHASVQG
jgi:ATP-dependent RNA helicase RhlE